jgi:uncharacterized tellurite resistance protein B-like protein
MTIERKQFQHLLFKVAFCTIACDGHIDEMEIQEMKALDKASIYFKDIDLSDELDNLLVKLKEKGKHIIDDLYADLKAIKLNPVQELLILEVAFRLAMANKVLDENEIKFIRFLRSHLNLFDEIIRDRFGAVDFLFDKDYSQDIVKSEIYRDMLSSISIPEIKEIQGIDFSSFKDEK